MKKSPIKILICVKNLDYANALCKAIQKIIVANVELVNFSTICNQISANDADFILLDLSAIIDDPFVSIELLKRLYPISQIIILSLWDQPNLTAKLMNCGVSNIYLIGSDAFDLIKMLTHESTQNPSK